MLDVAANRDGELVKVRSVLADRERIQQALRRMRVLAIASVDDRYPAHCPMHQRVRRAALLVAHDDRVQMHGLERMQRVKQLLALAGGGETSRLFNVSLNGQPALQEFDDAAFGISCIETALGSVLTLVDRGELELGPALRALTAGPAGVFGFAPGLGTLSVGAPDVCVIDPAHRWTVDARLFASKGRNTPLQGQELVGMVTAVVHSGIVAHELEAASA